MKPPRPKSALTFVLLGLVPYSRPNMLLAFRPNRFFNELEKISNYKRYTLEQAARRACQQGLIEEARNQQLRLTTLGRRRVLPYVAEKLTNNAKLMLIFDIPEDQAIDRQRLRRLLRKWKFTQTQKSVWITEYDFTGAIKEVVAELGLEGCVELYECALLYPK
ncbi:hypothetical protein BVY00_01275 [bacterium G20]|nr:hypothetical protein BVY00_01275 [bacterium G20]